MDIYQGSVAALAGMTGSYLVTLVRVALSGIGVAAHHPAGAGAALRSMPHAAPTNHATQAALRDVDWRSFGELIGAIVRRTIVFVGLSAFIPIYTAQRVGGTTLQTALIPLIVLPGIGWLFLRTLREPGQSAAKLAIPVPGGRR
ncbi:hypothetical protein [Arthrobacter sp. ERGS1:01]|uniref:hypothetical protein n=1 Tax=Arthrobacter sp. ERGS1:01 TaxID=1704044 RepID=UPI000AFF0767|nr:hypothetical protein [Arthrobacter sp. ERGS1:01]